MINPMKKEKTVIADAINTTEASGKPKRLAKIEARVCSCQVTGSQ